MDPTVHNHTVEAAIKVVEWVEKEVGEKLRFYYSPKYSLQRAVVLEAGISTATLRWLQSDAGYMTIMAIEEVFDDCHRRKTGGRSL